MQFKGYYKKLLKQQRWINNDLTNAVVDGHANFLVAMGIFNYIEMLGGYCLPRGNNTDKFNFVFKNLLPQPAYTDIFNKINAITNVRDGKPYGILRCGMSHEYFIKTYRTTTATIVVSYTIMGSVSKEAFDKEIQIEPCGIKVKKMRKDRYHIIIYNARLIHDLNLAFEALKKKIKTDLASQGLFIQRAQDINLEKFN